ncbi:MAG: recombinase family protein [Firmicutes bacterium]|nr:recombinase family protein [Bacillota bacterium]
MIKFSDFQERFGEIPQRIGVYMRIGNTSPDRSSFDIQLYRYRSLIESHSNWTLADVYCDKGVSGMRVRNRPQLLRMLEDCRTGKLDFIITKSISRLCLNSNDFFKVADMLAESEPPVGIYFEDVGLLTLGKADLILLHTVISLAEEESEQKNKYMLSYKKSRAPAGRRHIVGGKAWGAIYQKESYRKLTRHTTTRIGVRKSCASPHTSVCPQTAVTS